MVLGQPSQNQSRHAIALLRRILQKEAAEFDTFRTQHNVSFTIDMNLSVRITTTCGGQIDSLIQLNLKNDRLPEPILSRPACTSALRASASAQNESGRCPTGNSRSRDAEYRSVAQPRTTTSRTISRDFTGARCTASRPRVYAGRDIVQQITETQCVKKIAQHWIFGIRCRPNDYRILS